MQECYSESEQHQARESSCSACNYEDFIKVVSILALVNSEQLAREQ